MKNNTVSNKTPKIKCVKCGKKRILCCDLVNFNIAKDSFCRKCCICVCHKLDRVRK